jgi:hypothetical protein
VGAARRSWISEANSIPARFASKFMTRNHGTSGGDGRDRLLRFTDEVKPVREGRDASVVIGPGGQCTGSGHVTSRSNRRVRVLLGRSAWLSAYCPAAFCGGHLDPVHRYQVLGP